ncbi:MAG: hypothetical protein M1296_05500 [Chloroflexi bacterium]|nr:hypothetical protein [Chloroflexota bacterium]
MLRRYLHTGWSLKQQTGERHVVADLSQPDGWIPAQVPGTVYQDLVAARAIPDPFVGRNEDLGDDRLRGKVERQHARHLSW